MNPVGDKPAPSTSLHTPSRAVPWGKWSSVFSIAPDCHAKVGHYATLWHRHFYEGLASAGMEVSTPQNLDFSWSYDPGMPAQEQEMHRARCCEILRPQLFSALHERRLDAVISYARSNQIDPLLVREVEKAGVPWVNFFCDSVGQFHQVRELASAASLNWFPESASVSDYTALGRPLLCRPYAYNPAHLTAVQRAPMHDLGFVGLPTSNRVTILGALRLLGCPCRIHGPGWQDASTAAFSNTESRWKKARRLLIEPGKTERLFRRIAWPLARRQAHGPLDDGDLVHFLGRCRIVLGLNDSRAPDGSLVSYLKFRDLEMPGYGCCYLTQENADITSALEPDKEVLTFGSIFEARDKIKFYSGRSEVSSKIGDAGRQRVLGEHSWTRRLSEIQDKLR